MEPPTVNRMLGWAKAGREKKANLYYVFQQKWKREARLFLPARPPDAPWMRWRIVSAHFRLWSYRDPLELMTGLKWIADLLVDDEYLWDDNHKCLISFPGWGTGEVTQCIDRKNRGVRVAIEGI